MATILDTLQANLGLDTSDFEAGTKRAIASQNKLTDEFKDAAAWYDRTYNAQKQLTDSTREITIAQMKAIEMNEAMNNGYKQVTDSTRAMTLAQMEAIKMDLARNAVAEESVAGLGRLRQGFTSLFAQLSGSSPILDRTASTLGSFAVGTGLTVGIVGGLSAIAYFWDQITAAAKAAEQATKEAGDRLAQLQSKQNLGSVGQTALDMRQQIALRDQLLAQLPQAIKDAAAPHMGSSANQGQDNPAIAALSALQAKIQTTRDVIQAGANAIADVSKNMNDKLAADAARSAAAYASVSRSIQEQTSAATEATGRAAALSDLYQNFSGTADQLAEAVATLNTEYDRYADLAKVGLNLSAQQQAAHAAELQALRDSINAKYDQIDAEKKMQELLKAGMAAGVAATFASGAMLGSGSEQNPAASPKARLNLDDVSKTLDEFEKHTRVVFNSLVSIYNSGNLAMGTLQGALEGFKEGGPVGAVIGEVAGLVTSFFGQAAKLKEARAQFAQTEDSYIDGLKKFSSSFEQQYAEIQKNYQAIVDAASKARLAGPSDAAHSAAVDAVNGVRGDFNDSLTQTYNSLNGEAGAYANQLAEIQRQYEANIETAKQLGVYEKDAQQIEDIRTKQLQSLADAQKAAQTQAAALTDALIAQAAAAQKAAEQLNSTNTNKMVEYFNGIGDTFDAGLAQLSDQQTKALQDIIDLFNQNAITYDQLIAFEDAQNAARQKWIDTQKALANAPVSAKGLPALTDTTAVATTIAAAMDQVNQAQAVVNSVSTITSTQATNLVDYARSQNILLGEIAFNTRGLVGGDRSTFANGGAIPYGRTSSSGSSAAAPIVVDITFEGDVYADMNGFQLGQAIGAGLAEAMNRKLGSDARFRSRISGNATI